MNKILIIILLLPILSLSSLVAEANRNNSHVKTIAIQKCSACHGISGNSRNAQWPNIAGLNKSYILKQLEDFKRGTRINPEMELVVKSLTSDEELSALALYFSQQKITPINDSIMIKDASRKLVDLKLGKELFIGERLEYGIPACTACHGDQGQGSIDKKGRIYPRLTDQYQQYSIKQLKLFRASKRSNDSPAMMRNIASMMDDEDIASVVAYIARLNSQDK